jgi:hypothetical protein
MYRLSAVAGIATAVGAWPILPRYIGVSRANLSDYMTLSVKEILPLMNRFTSVATNKMNGAQLGIICTKV